MLNNNGYKQFLSTLTEISNKVAEQKFYEIKNLPDYVDFSESNNFKDELLKWVVGSNADDGETGIVGANGDFEKNASVEVAIGSKSYPRVQWTKKITYNFFDIQQANETSIINLIEAKETARKKNFDLMIQKIIFLGSAVNPNIKGLLNNDEATVNTTTITKSLSSMSDSELNAFIQSVINAFLANNNETAMFNRLVIPSKDYNGLSVPYSIFNNGSKLQVIENAFKSILAGYGMADSFRILPSVYANADKNETNKNIYAVYNKDTDALEFDVGVPYQVLGTNTYDNYNFSNNAIAMFGGVNVYRNQELMYFVY